MRCTCRWSTCGLAPLCVVPEDKASRSTDIFESRTLSVCLCLCLSLARGRCCFSRQERGTKWEFYNWSCNCETWLVRPSFRLSVHRSLCPFSSQIQREKS